MLKFNAQIRYGLRAIIFLANKNKLTSIKEIAKAEKIPQDFLEKIMLQLKKAKIVDSTRGKNGGFKLIIKPNKINLQTIFQALDKKLIQTPCHGACFKKKTCQAKSIWQTIDQTFKTSLKQVKLSKIIK